AAGCTGRAPAPNEPGADRAAGRRPAQPAAAYVGNADRSHAQDGRRRRRRTWYLLGARQTLREAAMARLEPIEIGELDADLTAICEDAERQTGTSMSTRTLAHHPGVVKALAAFRRT